MGSLYTTTSVFSRLQSMCKKLGHTHPPPLLSKKQICRDPHLLIQHRAHHVIHGQVCLAILWFLLLWLLLLLLFWLLLLLLLLLLSAILILTDLLGGTDSSFFEILPRGFGTPQEVAYFLRGRQRKA